MPSRIRCPGCDTLLSVPEDLQGKRVRCPRCGDAIAVPRPAEVEEKAHLEERVRTRPAAPDQPLEEDQLRRRPRHDEDAIRRRVRHEDDDEHERPRRRRRPPPRRQNLTLILLCAGGGLVLVVGVGLTLWLILSSGSSKKTGGDAAQPDQRGGADVQPKVDRNANALAFNQKIVEGNKRIASASFQLGVAAGIYIKQGGHNAQNVRDAYQTVLTTFDAIRNEAQTWPVPPAKSAQDLFHGYLRFLKAGRDEMEKFGQVLAGLDDARLTADQKSQRLNQAVQDMAAAERAQLPELQRLQRVFAQEHKITLLPGQ